MNTITPEQRSNLRQHAKEFANIDTDFALSLLNALEAVEAERDAIAAWFDSPEADLPCRRCPAGASCKTNSSCSVEVKKWVALKAEEGQS